MGAPDLTPAAEAVPILALGAELGKLTLEGRQADCTWQYRVHMYDCSEFDQPPISRHSAWTADWSEAIEEMDKRAWENLYPLSVHPDFTAVIRRLLVRRGRIDNDLRSEWGEVFGENGGTERPG